MNRRGLTSLVVLMLAMVPVALPAERTESRAQRMAALPDWNGIWVSDATDVDISGYPSAGLGAFNLKLVGGRGAPVMIRTPWPAVTAP